MAQRSRSRLHGRALWSEAQGREGEGVAVSEGRGCVSGDGVVCLAAHLYIIIIITHREICIYFMYVYIMTI